MGGVTEDTTRIETCENPVPVEAASTWGEIKAGYAD